MYDSGVLKAAQAAGFTRWRYGSVHRAAVPGS